MATRPIPHTQIAASTPPALDGRPSVQFGTAVREEAGDHRREKTKSISCTCQSQGRRGKQRCIARAGENADQAESPPGKQRAARKTAGTRQENAISRGSGRRSMPLLILHVSSFSP